MNTSRTQLDLVSAMSDKASSVHRRRLGGVLLVLCAAAILVAGGWGVVSAFGSGPAPASIGEPVEVPGGAFRVDAATPEHMAPMQADKFAASGMSMSAMGMDMAPEGYRRLTVEVTLGADDEQSLSYSPEDFRVSGDGMDEVAPLRHQLEAGTVPPGGAISGSMVFQVPEEAENLVLGFGGGQSVALDSNAIERPEEDHDH